MTTLKVTNIHTEPEGDFRYYVIFTTDRLSLVRIEGFINRAGFSESFLKEKSHKKTPQDAWYSVWRIGNRPLAGRLFKEAYRHINGIIGGTLPSYRGKKYYSSQRHEFISKLEQIEANR